MKSRFHGALALLAFSGTTLAGPQDIDFDACNPPPAKFQFTATVGATLTATIPVLNNGGGRLFFEFILEPRSTAGVVCPGPSPRFTCNGIAIALPGPAEDPAPPDAQVRISGAANRAGTFVFKLIVAPEDGSKPGCEREYQIEIKDPPTPAPPTGLDVK